MEAPAEIKEATSASTPNFATLPTSGDSEELLRIRHSVSPEEAAEICLITTSVQLCIIPDLAGHSDVHIGY